MIWGGGAEEIEKKKISEALLQEEINLKRPSPGKIYYREGLGKFDLYSPTKKRKKKKQKKNKKKKKKNKKLKHPPTNKL